MRPFYKLYLLLCIFLALIGLNGCLGDTDGIDPPSDEFVNPVALSTVLADSHLLVVNSNFNLAYNAGTLVAYSLSRLDSYGGQPISYNADIGTFILPPWVTFSQFCTGGKTSAYCNLSAADGIRAHETIRLGAYASEMNITPKGDRALIPVRGEEAILAVDIGTANDNVIDCGESENSEKRCDDSHRIFSNGDISLPIEPYDVTTMEYAHEENGMSVVETLGFASHRAGGEVSLFAVSSQKGDGPVVYDNRLIRVIDGVIQGASGIAANPLKHDIYVVGQRDESPRVAVLNVDTDWRAGGSFLSDPAFGQTRTIRINDEIMYGSGARDITVSPDGKSGFVVTQNPPAILNLDLEQYKVREMSTICRESSKVETYVDERDPDNPLDDKLYAWVLCFFTGQVYIFDADYMVKVIRKAGTGPQDITFDKTRNIAYVANFTESTISMIQSVAPFNLVQVVEANNTDAPLILRIGKP